MLLLQLEGVKDLLHSLSVGATQGDGRELARSLVEVDDNGDLGAIGFATKDSLKN